MKHVYHCFNFRPVGQGLFSHGCLHLHEPNSQAFSWLYDCGTSSKYSLLQDQIEQYSAVLGRYGSHPIHNYHPDYFYHVPSSTSKETINLAVLSHYDQDHVNGIVEIAKRHRIKTLVIPYIYPAQRCILLGDTPGKAFWYQRFLESPASYLLEVGGENIEQIVRIRPGGELPEEPAGEDSPDTPWPPTNRNADNKEQEIAPDGFSENGDQDALYDSRVTTIDTSAPLIRNGLWEFCFFNRPQDSNDLKLWWDEASSIYSDFLESSKSPEDYHDLIRGMKRATTQNSQLPRKKFSANEISLQMYMGPILYRLKEERVHDIRTYSTQHHFGYREHFSREFAPKGGGFLFTGDITMDQEMSDFTRRDFLGKNRWSNLTYLQVPHHGARRSWRPGVYHDWNHKISVFSAKGSERGYGHPHREVVEDLENHNPIHVTAERGFSGCSAYKFR